jgi:hypothetical protein
MRDQISHVDRYTIMEQPQPSCVNLQLTCCINIAHRSSYDIEVIPFTSFSSKTSLAYNDFYRNYDIATADCNGIPASRLAP